MPRPTRPDDLPIVTRCAWCKRYAIGGGWVPEADALGSRPNERFEITHGICPTCLAKVQGSRTGR